MSHRELQRIYVSWRQALLLSWAFLGTKTSLVAQMVKRLSTMRETWV